jgi:hypothetical protein
VFSFGYPLGVTMDQAFKDRVVTMNKGNISALRKDNLGIQHSAAISGGNSGGPLVDANGLVLGMNSAEMRQGNSLFLAVGADLIRDFLGRKGFAGLFDASVPPPLASGAMAAAVPLPASAGVRLNALGEIECSADVLIDAEKGAAVYFDGARIGVAPLVTTLSKPITEMEIRGEMGAFSGKLRLLQSLSGLTAVRPALVPYRTEVVVTSEPAGAEVAEDGKVLGTTPLRMEMPTGEHAFDLTLQGYFFDPVRVVAKRSAPGAAHAVGSVLIPVSVRNMKTGTTVKLTFRSGSRELAFGSDRKIALPAGDWRLTAPEVAWLNGVEIPVAVADEPVVVDAAAFARTGTVRIADLGPNSRVWLNGSELSVPSNPLRLPLGSNNLYCWEDGRLPLPETVIRVKPDETLTVQWPRVTGNEVWAKRYARTGLIMALVGAAVIAHGAYNNLNEVATEKASSYDEYRDIKDRTKAEIYIGGSVVAVSALMDLIGLGYRRSFVAQRKFRDGLGGTAE